MKYGDFKKQSQKTKTGRKIFSAWMDGKLPLTWAIGLFKISKKKNGKK